MRRCVTTNRTRPAARSCGLTSSKWVALTREPGELDARLAQIGGDWRPLSDDRGPRLWTDDYASVLPLLF